MVVGRVRAANRNGIGIFPADSWNGPPEVPVPTGRYPRMRRGLAIRGVDRVHGDGGYGFRRQLFGMAPNGFDSGNEPS